MLAAIAEKISERGLSVEDLTTELRIHRGRREFVVNAFISSNNLSDKENLDSLLEHISMLKGELDLEILDVRVHTA